MATEMLEHRGYRLAVIEMPPVWNVQFTRPRKDLPKPGCSDEIVLMPARDDAIAEAKRRIDVLVPRALAAVTRP